MSSNMKNNGLKPYFQSAIVYYYKNLAENGCDDPARIVIADFLSTIKITDKQKEFVLASTSNDKKILNDIITILENMRKSNKLDLKALELAENGLKHLRDK